MKNDHGPACPQTCQICGAHALSEVESFSSLPRITSDCRSFAAGGRLFVCLSCGGVQKLPDATWLREIKEIYSGYKVYYQSDGDEQLVCDPATGTPRRRSEVILDRLVAGKYLGAKGRAIDVGCGNGATLNAMSRVLRGWTLSGYELEGGALARLSRIPRFEKLYSGGLDAIDTEFDLVTMIHSLEHFPFPGETLKQLLPVVKKGVLFVEVSNIEENPFDILIADHLTHFSPATLSFLLSRCGLKPVTAATDWIPKEISLLAKTGGKFTGHGEAARTSGGENAKIRMGLYTDWLRQTVCLAGREARDKKAFGIFGTSIAGTWLANALADAIDFFVDEDPSRIGKKHCGKPVLHPSQVPQGATVYFALAPSLAGKVAARLRSHGFQTLLPPPLEIP